MRSVRTRTPRWGTALGHRGSDPVEDEAIQNATYVDRCVSQYGLPADDSGRSCRAPSGLGMSGLTVRVAILSWGSQARRRPTHGVTAGSRVVSTVTEAGSRSQ